MISAAVIGSGGREHSLVWKLLQEGVKTIYCLPGNTGTELEEGCVNVDMDATDPNNHNEIIEFLKSKKVDAAIVGPEKVLADGFVDKALTMGYDRVFGSTVQAAQLETDKIFSWEINKKLKIPQAASIKCNSLDEIINAISILGTEHGVVLKFAGLAGGKGVTVYDSIAEAIADAPAQVKKFGTRMLVAERLFGREFSVFGISDGNTVTPINMAFADYKRLLDGDKGPMTGGIGSYGPVSFVKLSVIRDITRDILQPIVDYMRENLKTPYKGFIYAGMIMTNYGPKVIEYNVRFGDPECQPAMMMLKSGLYAPISLALDGKADQIQFEYNSGAACCIVPVTRKYPKSSSRESGLVISGLNSEFESGTKIFHSETARIGRDIVTKKSGRTLGVTYHGQDISGARAGTYRAVKKVTIPGGFYFRGDIAKER